MEDQRQQRKRPFWHDWNTIFYDAPLPEVPEPITEGLELLDDSELEDVIRRQSSLLKINAVKNFPDGGAKHSALAKILAEKINRHRLSEEVDEDKKKKKPRQATSSSVVGVSSDLSQENMSSQPPSQSSLHQTALNPPAEDHGVGESNTAQPDEAGFAAEMDVDPNAGPT